MKIILFTAIFIPTILFILYAIFVKDDKDICLDIGSCNAGMEVNVEGKKIIVNEISCKENNGKWINNSYCQF